MRTLERNKRTVYYAIYQGAVPILDENGYDTSETAPSYGEPIKLRINVSPATGESTTRQFGEVVDYDRTLVTSNIDIPINEQTVLWIDNIDISSPYDYIVKKIAKGLDSVLIAVKKVEVSTNA